MVAGNTNWLVVCSVVSLWTVISGCVHPNGPPASADDTVTRPSIGLAELAAMDPVYAAVFRTPACASLIQACTEKIPADATRCVAVISIRMGEGLGPSHALSILVIAGRTNALTYVTNVDPEQWRRTRDWDAITPWCVLDGVATGEFFIYETPPVMRWGETEARRELFKSSIAAFDRLFAHKLDADPIRVPQLGITDHDGLDFTVSILNEEGSIRMTAEYEIMNDIHSLWMAIHRGMGCCGDERPALCDAR